MQRLRVDTTVVVEGDGFIRAPAGLSGSLLEQLRLREQASQGLVRDRLPYGILQSFDFKYPPDAAHEDTPRDRNHVQEENVWIGTWNNWSDESLVEINKQPLIRSLLKDHSSTNL